MRAFQGDSAKYLKDKAKLLRRKSDWWYFENHSETLDAVTFAYTGKHWDRFRYLQKNGKATLDLDNFSLPRFLHQTGMPYANGKSLAQSIFQLPSATNKPDVKVRLAKQKDLDQILKWLELEQDQHPDDEGFFRHARILQENLEEKDLFVAVETKTGRAIGFVTGPVFAPDLLSVKLEFRQSGVGTALMGYAIKRARSQKLTGIVVDTRLAELPFFKTLGFEEYKPSGSLYQKTVWAGKQLEYRHKLPEGEDVKVRVAFYPEARLRDQATTPLIEFTPKARQAADGSIQLSQRISFIQKRYDFKGDLVARIEIDGECVFENKSKYSEALQFGLRRDALGYFLDVIRDPSRQMQNIISQIGGESSADQIGAIPDCRGITTTLNALWKSGHSMFHEGFSLSPEQGAYQKISRRFGPKSKKGDEALQLRACLDAAGVDGFLYALFSVGQVGEAIIKHFFARVLQEIEPILIRRKPEDENLKKAYQYLLGSAGETILEKLFFDSGDYDFTAHRVRRAVEKACPLRRQTAYSVVSEAISAILNDRDEPWLAEKNHRQIYQEEMARFERIASDYFN